MIDLSDELVPLGRAGHLIPGPAAKPHASTLARWARRGVGKSRARLETVLLGGRRYTSRAALIRFFSRLSEASGNAGAPLVEERAESIRRAERDLNAEGIA
jgi:hypothetical protein